MSLFSKRERKVFTRWLGNRYAEGRPVCISWEFEFKGGIHKNDAVFLLDMADAISRTAMDFHDVERVRLRSIRQNGKKVL